MATVQERARQRDIEVLQSPMGIAVAPLRHGQAIEPDAFRALPPDERARYQSAMDEVGAELQALLRRFHQWGREHYEELQALDREMATLTARRVLDHVRRACHALPEVLDHLNEVEADVVDNADAFLEGAPEGVEAQLKRALRPDGIDGPPFRRYQVNVVVDRTGLAGAPVVFEDHPTYANLVGSIEHEAHFGRCPPTSRWSRAGRCTAPPAATSCSTPSRCCSSRSRGTR